MFLGFWALLIHLESHGHGCSERGGPLALRVLQVDLDVHQWAYIARKAFTGFINRLSSVIFENALVIQGNRSAPKA